MNLDMYGDCNVIKPTYIVLCAKLHLSKNVLDKVDKSLAEKKYVEYVDLEAPIE